MFYKFIVKVKKKYISYLMFSGSKEIKKYYLENFDKKIFFLKIYVSNLVLKLLIKKIKYIIEL